MANSEKEREKKAGEAEAAGGASRGPKAQKAQKALATSLPYLMVAGGLGALELLRGRFQKSHTFLPERYPNGTWNPGVFGLNAEDVWFRSEDGVDLHGWWIPHPRAAGTLLFCHGNTGSIAHRIGVLAYLHRLRLNVFAFDYRGYGRSAGTPSEKGLYRDARAAYDHLMGPLEQGQERIILFGHSLGGAVAIDCAQSCPTAGLIVQSSFTDTRSMARVFYPRVPIHWVTTNQFRSAEKVAKLTLPKLFVHSTEDTKIPFELGRNLYRAAAPPKELLVVSGADHNDLHLHGGFPYLRRLVRFTRRSIRQAAGRNGRAASLRPPA